MRAKEIFENLMAEAKSESDREHTRLFVSDTISKYIREEIKKMVRNNLENTLLDKELGIIDEETAEQEIEIARLVYRSVS